MSKTMLCRFFSMISIALAGQVQANTVYETYVELWNCSSPNPTSTCSTCNSCSSCSSLPCNGNGSCSSCSSSGCSCTTNPCTICYPVCKLYYGNTYLDMAFASYNGSCTGGVCTLAGTNVSSADDIDQISSYVQGSGGGKSKISFGGCTYPIYGGGFSACGLTATYSTYWPSGNSPTIANDGSGNYQMAVNMAGAINNTSYYGLNGADFDIEQPVSSLSGIPAYSGATLQTNQNIDTLVSSGVLSSEQINFAYYVAEIIGQVRSLSPSAILSLTIPGQATNYYWELLAQLVVQNNFVNYVQFMEYDISVDTSGYSNACNAYVATIISDMEYYHTGWGIPYANMSVGLMPACDDIGNFLSVDGASCVAYYAIQNGLYGVMTWDMDIDYCQYNFAYQTAIVNTFSGTPPPSNCTSFVTSTNSYSLTPQVASTSGTSYVSTFRYNGPISKSNQNLTLTLPPHGAPNQQ